MSTISIGQIVHADPMMWGHAGGAEAVAQQLYAGWFVQTRTSDHVEAAAPGLADTEVT
jgi:hypothetical protein